MQKFVAKVALLLCLPVLAMAQGTTYIQGELGAINQSNGKEQMFHTDVNPSGPAGRIAIGQLFGEAPLKFGFETGVTYYNNSTITNSVIDGTDIARVTTKYSGYHVDLLAVAKYNFDSGFSVFGKAGEAYLYQRAKYSYDSALGIDASKTYKGHKYAPVVALGVGYQITPKTELNLTATSIYAGAPYSSDRKNPATALQTVFLGLTYQLD